MFECRFLAIMDVRTIYRYQAEDASPVEWCQWKGRIALHAGHASPVKWCLNEKVELLCSASWPCLAYQVVFEWKGRIALQAGHASPVKWCSYNVYSLLGGHWPRGSTGSPVKWCLNEKVPCLSSGYGGHTYDIQIPWVFQSSYGPFGQFLEFCIPFLKVL